MRRQILSAITSHSRVNFPSQTSAFEKVNVSLTFPKVSHRKCAPPDRASRLRTSRSAATLRAPHTGLSEFSPKP